MIARILPHPVLTLFLTGVWLLLANSASPGNLILGLLLGVVIPLMTAPYWPDRPQLRRPAAVLGYLGVVIGDIIVANIEVAKLILFRPRDQIRSAWIQVPLELTAPEAIAVLAGTITLTPGTVTTMTSADGGCLLVHCLHTDDPDAVRATIKDRYERRLLEIFA